MATFADRLKAIRESRGLTQDALADRVKTSKQVISRYENGDRIPKITMAQKLADALNVPLKELSGDDSDAPPLTPAPKTQEARIISEGVDRLPPKARKNALEFYNTLFKMLENEFREEDENDT